MGSITDHARKAGFEVKAILCEEERKEQKAQYDEDKDYAAPALEQYIKRAVAMMVGSRQHLMFFGFF